MVRPLVKHERTDHHRDVDDQSSVVLGRPHRVKKVDSGSAVESTRVATSAEKVSWVGTFVSVVFWVICFTSFLATTWFCAPDGR